MHLPPWVHIAWHAVALPCNTLSHALGCVALQGRPMQERAAARVQEADAHSSPAGFYTATPATAEQRKGTAAAHLPQAVALLAKLGSAAPGVMSQSRLLGA